MLSDSAGEPGLTVGPGRRRSPPGEKPEGQASILAGDATPGPQLADTLDPALALVARVVARAPTAGVPEAMNWVGEGRPFNLYLLS